MRLTNALRRDDDFKAFRIYLFGTWSKTVSRYIVKYCHRIGEISKDRREWHGRDSMRESIRELFHSVSPSFALK